MDRSSGQDDWAAHTKALRRMARALVRDVHLSEDVAQSACLAALERPPRRLSAAWFRRALRSRVLDVRRRAHTSHERSFGKEHEQTSPGADDVAQKLELHRAVLDEVQALDEPYRRTVYLRYFEDKTPSEIAAELGVPLKTVKTRLSRALPLLRSRLEREFGGPRALAVLFGLEWLSPSAPAGAGTVAMGGAVLMVKKIAVVLVFAVAFWGVLQLRDDKSSAAQLEERAAAAAVRPPELPVPLETADEAPESVETSRRELAASEAQPTVELPAPPLAGTIVARVTWSDEEPARGVTVDLRANAVRTNQDGLPRHGYARSVTDAAGLARFEQVEPGAFQVSARRTSGATEVEAGGEAHVSLEIPRGVDVEGRVVDASGASVPGASIWLSSGRTDWQGGSFVTRSDANGAFKVRSAPKDQSLGAVVAGRAPSPLVDLDDHDTSRSPVDLVLTVPAVETGCALRGRVLRPDGSPAPGAWVAVGEMTRYFRQRNEGHFEEWTPRLTMTDDQGRFELFGLPAGEPPLDVRFPGTPIWKGTVRLVPGPNEQDVQLQESARVVGIVRDANGEPVAGAVLRAFDAALDESFVQGGQFDYDHTFGYPSTVADETGAYVLDELPPGEAHLYASPAFRERTGFEALMRAQTVLVLAEGAEEVWDPVIDEGNVIAGVVLFAGGEPMPYAYVSARSEETGKSQSLYVGGDGRFRFLNMRDGAYTLRVQVWDAPKDAPPLEETGVRPNQPEVELVASWAKPTAQAASQLIGRFDDTSKRLSHEDAIGFHLTSDKGLFYSAPHELTEGAFRFKGVDPGRYRLVVFSGELPIHWTDWFELTPGETHDIGTIESEPGGSLLLRLDREPGTERVEPTAWLSCEGAPRSARVRVGTDTEHLVESLVPGSYTLRLSGEGMVTIRNVKAEVTRGEISLVDLDIERAGKQPFRVERPKGPVEGLFTMRVTSDRGRVFYDIDRLDANRFHWPMERSIPLPLGRYTAVVETDGGLRDEAAFTVEDLDGSLEAVRLRLR